MMEAKVWQIAPDVRSVEHLLLKKFVIWQSTIGYHWLGCRCTHIRLSDWGRSDSI